MLLQLIGRLNLCSLPKCDVETWSLQCTHTTSGLFSEVGDILCPTYLHIHRFWIFERWRTNQYQTETVIQSETTLCQLANTHIKKAANPWCSWPIHHCDRSQRCCLSQLLPWALGKISHKPTQMQVLEEAVKKGSSIYPTCGCFQGWEQCCLYGVVLSLSGHSQEWLLSCDGHCINQFWCSHLAMFAGRELDKRRTGLSGQLNFVCVCACVCVCDRDLTDDVISQINCML